MASANVYTTASDHTRGIIPTATNSWVCVCECSVCVQYTQLSAGSDCRVAWLRMWAPPGVHYTLGISALGLCEGGRGGRRKTYKRTCCVGELPDTDNIAPKSGRATPTSACGSTRLGSISLAIIGFTSTLLQILLVRSCEVGGFKFSTQAHAVSECACANDKIGFARAVIFSGRFSAVRTSVIMLKYATMNRREISKCGEKT